MFQLLKANNVLPVQSGTATHRFIYKFTVLQCLQWVTRPLSHKTGQDEIWAHETRALTVLLITFLLLLPQTQLTRSLNLQRVKLFSQGVKIKTGSHLLFDLLLFSNEKKSKFVKKKKINWKFKKLLTFHVFRLYLSARSCRTATLRGCFNYGHTND